MMATEERVSNSALQATMYEVGVRINQLCQDIGEIKSMLKSIEDRVRKLENDEAGTHPLIESWINQAWQKIDDHDKQLAALTKIVIQLQHANNIMTWIGGILGSTLIIWIVTQILAAVK